MKPAILVYTAFTAISRNTLQYACNLCRHRDFKLVLLHNYEPPFTYTADAIALSTIQTHYEHIEEKLEQELDWAMSHFEDLDIESRLVNGNFAETITELHNAFDFELLIVGAPESNGEFWGWNDDFVDAITSLPVPALIIPKHIQYEALVNVGFACNYAQPLTRKQQRFIQKAIDIYQVHLHVIHVDVPDKKNEARRLEFKAQLEDALSDHHPVYASIENTDVVATIINYVRQNDIQLLIVIPHKHGIWYNIFNQNHTRLLTRINHLPILAMQD